MHEWYSFSYGKPISELLRGTCHIEITQLHLHSDTGERTLP